MAIGYTELNFANGGPPPLSAANMNHIDEGVKACADALDLESAAGKAMTQAANAAAQRTLLNVEDGADVTDEANVTATAVGAAEVTDTPDHIWGLVGGALKRWTKAGFESVVKALLPSAIEGGTATVTPADTDVVPGVKADHSRLYYTWANIKAAIATAFSFSTTLPTANGKTVADAIGVATGATTALKLANLVSPATTAQQGVSLLGASGGAAKLTKMPDGATAVYANDTWLDLTGLLFNGASHAEANNEITITPTAGSSASMYITIGVATKIVLIKVKRPSASAATMRISTQEGAGAVTHLNTFTISTQYGIYAALCPVGATRLYVYPDTTGANTPITMSFLWIGDYSYLPGSLSEEAARIADQLGDTPGVGAAATATITSNGTNVNTPASGTLTTTTSLPAADSTFQVGTKTYTWKSALTPAEGEVLLEATVAACLTNARDAVNGTAGTLGTKHQCTANTLFTASASATILTVTAILRGTVGNGATYQIVAGAGSELTASGALATGGVDDTVTIGGKVYTFVGDTPNAEGEVLVGSTSGNSFLNLRIAVDRYNPSAYDGVLYKIAAANPLAIGDVTGAYGNSSVITLTAGTQTSNSTPVYIRAPGILGNSITIAKSASATTLTLTNPAGGTTTLAGGVDDVGAKMKAQVGPAIGAGANVGAMPTRTATSIIGYRGIADCASGAQVTLPVGGTWLWRVGTYGATYNSLKAGTAAGGLMSGTASANLTMFYERIA